jgi:2-polyprenyl-3-methyl-5-hydroxy-6-metoxy-1,4-benzoquinol methylase
MRDTQRLSVSFKLPILSEEEIDSMATPATMQQPTPERFFFTVNAYQQAEAMRAALELEIFTAIAEGNATAAAIAKRCQAAERGVRILCDFLTIHGFLTKNGTEYGLAPDAAVFLNRHSPAYIGGVTDFLLHAGARQRFASLTETVRAGGTTETQGSTVEENPEWVIFARAMMPLMRMPAELMTAELRKGGEAHKVLDVAAGHGMYGISAAKGNPAAQVYAADWKNVLEVAKANAQGMGVGDRYHLIPGNAFETDFGSGYDLVLIPNFLHHFDVPACTTFLKKVRAALAPGGRAAILEFIPNADRVSPPAAAAFSLMMLANTPRGDAYTFAEIESMAKDAGFGRTELSPTEITLSRLAVAYV